MRLTIHLPKKRTVIITVVSILIIVAIALAVSLGLYMWHKNNLASEVKKDLQTIAVAMEKSLASGNGYPAGIPIIQGSMNVSISGSSSFDGKSYCVTGISKEDKSIVFHIGSADNSKTTQSGSCVDGTTGASPTIPAGIVVTAGTDSISVTWQPSLYATGYTLQCATDNQFTKNVETKDVTNSAASCDKLQPNTEYFYRVKSTNASKQSDWSVVSKSSTMLLSVAPTGLKAIAVSSTRVNYSWQAVPGATGYVIERATDINFMQNVVSVSQVSTTGSSTGLKPDTTYYYHVKAVTPQFSSDQAAFSNGSIVKTAAS